MEIDEVTTPTPTATQASREAVHAAKDAQQATEAAREAQNHELAALINTGIADTLEKIFGDGDGSGKNDPIEMRVLWKRIPLLCKRVDDMHNKLENADGKLDRLGEKVGGIDDNLKWAVRIVIGAVILGVLASLWK